MSPLVASVAEHRQSSWAQFQLVRTSLCSVHSTCFNRGQAHASHQAICSIHTSAGLPRCPVPRAAGAGHVPSGNHRGESSPDPLRCATASRATSPARQPHAGRRAEQRSASRLPANSSHFPLFPPPPLHSAALLRACRTPAAATSTVFSARMSRLTIVMAPAACAAAGVGLSRVASARVLFNRSQARDVC